MSDPTPVPDAATLARRLEAVRAEIGARATADEVTLVVVTKTAPPGLFPVLADLGVSDLGENRVQGAAERLAGQEDAFRWHFIGHLQSNKARKALPLFDVFHGVDSLDLLRRLDRQAGELGRAPELYLQVNVSGEASKAGLDPADLPALLEAAADLEQARVVGLMTMAPRVPDPERARPVFAALARLRDEGQRRLPGLTGLSMGMTEDFGVALEEGATAVRIGRRLVAG